MLGLKEQINLRKPLLKVVYFRDVLKRCVEWCKKKIRRECRSNAWWDASFDRLFIDSDWFIIFSDMTLTQIDHRIPVFTWTWCIYSLHLFSSSQWKHNFFLLSCPKKNLTNSRNDTKRREKTMVISFRKCWQLDRNSRFNLCSLKPNTATIVSYWLFMLLCFLVINI